MVTSGASTIVIPVVDYLLYTFRVVCVKSVLQITIDIRWPGVYMVVVMMDHQNRHPEVSQVNDAHHQ
jgi:hypothetical protein